MRSRLGSFCCYRTTASAASTALIALLYLADWPDGRLVSVADWLGWYSHTAGLEAVVPAGFLLSGALAYPLALSPITSAERRTDLVRKIKVAARSPRRLRSARIPLCPSRTKASQSKAKQSKPNRTEAEPRAVSHLDSDEQSEREPQRDEPTK